MPQRSQPRVLVTRTRAQSSALGAHLRDLGAEPVLLPLIEVGPPASYAGLDTALRSLSSFDWLLFTSSNAVAFLFRRAAELGIDPVLLAGRQRIAAIGPATAATLAHHRLAVDLLPEQAVAESLAAALLPHARRPDGTPARLLLPRAEQARDTLPEALSAAGALLTVAPAYRNAVPPGALAALQDLLTVGQRLDAVTFTSSSSAHNLFALLGEAHLTLPPEVLRISIGPVTSQTLAELGHPAHREAAAPSIAALAAAVMEATAGSV